MPDNNYLHLAEKYYDKILHVTFKIWPRQAFYYKFLWKKTRVGNKAFEKLEKALLLCHLINSLTFLIVWKKMLFDGDLE